MAVRRTTVLVVDDEPAFSRFLGLLLASAGLGVIQAASADQAMLAARRQRPDVAILDVALPGVSGFGLCRDLRNECGSGLPVLFVSGSRVDAIDRTAGLLIGGDDYLIKPVHPDELLARVRRLLERSGAWLKSTTLELSPRETAVLQLIAEGLPPRAVAERLVISPKTVSSHVQRIMSKLDVHTRAQAVAVAYEAGLIRLPQRDDVQAHVLGYDPLPA
jgi:DNA-binding NarL/FixJ family response regulator